MMVILVFSLKRRDVEQKSDRCHVIQTEGRGPPGGHKMINKIGSKISSLF